MPGLDDDTPIPTGVTVHQQSRVLELSYAGGRVHRIPFELLRVCSPSAEVQGHGPGQETLQTGKRDVTIEGLVPVGHYGLQPLFSDGHQSGIYTWALLHELGSQPEQHWQHYLAKLAAAGLDRDQPMAPPAAGCASH